MRDVLERNRPDIVLVHGDTSTSFAAALACFYLGVPVGHVEAGLRTHNLRSPWPEEFNRQAVDIVSDYYFAPTETSKQNLLDEGKPSEKIFVTGNTGIDALRTTVCPEYTDENLEWASDSKLILITAHRRENLGEPMRSMFRAIRRVMDEHPDVKAIYPIHMNPIVREAAHEELDGCDRLRIIEPLEVLDFHNYLARCYMVLTDSGGIQEEAPGVTPFGKFMREKRLDEIPQFWNVITGKMSLTGPRPERPAFCDEFEKRIHGWHYRTKVRPGLSGLAQVTGGYDLLPKEKIVLDLEYIENRSAMLDLKIILRTLGVVKTGRGAR